MAHVIELEQGFAQGGVQSLAKLILLLIRLRQWWREPADYARQTQEGYDIQAGIASQLTANLFGGLRVRMQQVAIDLHWDGATGLDVNIDVDMAAMNAFAHD